MSEPLVLSTQSGAVRTLTLNRPKALNSFTSEMHVALAAGYIATGMAVIAFVVGFFLPEPKGEPASE